MIGVSSFINVFVLVLLSFVDGVSEFRVFVSFLLKMLFSMLVLECIILVVFCV